ncbi:MAG: hypothetical protein KC983_11160 [Phycisphaerales bacterium]|nr:hypothetical protein [Phycisphaerales bacterium]
MKSMHSRRMIVASSAMVIMAAVVSILTATASSPNRPAAASASPDAAGAWATDPAWYNGKAEWALYESTRMVYGAPRRFETTIFTNKQFMDRTTTTKVAGDASGERVEVFKHNVSEMVPTANYIYRFLTTSFVRTRDMTPYKLVASTQEDCGATYHQFVVDNGTVKADEFSYFPAEGAASTTYPAPDDLAFHDMLTLTLRNYPFDAPRDVQTIQLIRDQTDTHHVDQTPARASVGYLGAETISVPFGTMRTHHLRVTHPHDGGKGFSDYWFAADDHRHVLVQYEGPYSVTYRLKRLDWWAYWSDPRPE